jgi:hypothetical protein
LSIKFPNLGAGIKNKTVVVTEDKTFDAGFFKVQSPVKNPSPHCAGKNIIIQNVRKFHLIYENIHGRKGQTVR